MEKETKQQKLAILHNVLGELLDIVDPDELLNVMEEINNDLDMNENVPYEQ